VTRARLLLWSVNETAGVDAAWARVDGTRLTADGHAVGQTPEPYSVRYELETDSGWTTRRLQVEARRGDAVTTLDLRRHDMRWTVNGAARTDLAEALDCDLEACPLTNTMPIRRHDLHRQPGDVTFLMAFVTVPALEVIPSRQRYTTLRASSGGGPSTIRYRSDGFQSDLEIDGDGFVLVYPQLGRRILPVSSARDG
jgi:uncharacterized protein